MQLFSAARTVAALFAVFSLGLLINCGGGSSSSNPVTSLQLTPTNLSLSPGQTFQITAQPKNYAGTNVTADVSYSSSNTGLVTVTPGGLVCAGVWDPNYITCNPVQGQAAVGQAIITAKSETVSAPLTVYTHLQVDRIFVTPPTRCVSMGATPSYLATVFNITAPGCSSTIPCDITSTVGPITFNSTDLQVMTNNVNSGVLTAENPGGTTIYASVAGLHSIPQPAQVCPVVSITVHDAASSNTTFNLAPTNTQGLVADVIDSAGNSITPTLTWSSIPAGVASVAPTTSTSTTPAPPNGETVTANTGGTTTITASCSTPNCNRNVGPQYSQNVVTVNVSGGTTTTVYAASTNSLTMIPISTSNNTAGTAITLPYLPNSIVSDSVGNKVYLGSGSGIITVDVTSGAPSASTAVSGTILAVSPDGTYLFISNASTGFSYLFSTTGSSVLQSHQVVATAAAFSADSHSVTLISGQQLYYDTITPTSTFSNLTYLPSSVDLSAQGGMTYITGPALGALDVRTTCNQQDWQTLSASHPNLVAHLPNGTGAVAADSPDIALITTAAIPKGCPPNPQNTLNSYNLGVGNFRANQLFVSPDSSRAWILSNLSSVIGLNLNSLTPFSISLVNGAQPLSGGITIDGAQVYVGGSDSTVHNISVANGSDSAQIAPGLKDGSGNTVTPNLVWVLPK
jgi:hypothetical protein